LKKYYQILNLSKEAGIKEIRKSYRRLALQLHPDVNNSADANERFIELGEAYEVLKNPVSRKRYDNLYDYQILKRKPKQSGDYQRKKQTWEEVLRKKQKQGAKKAESRRKENYKSFEKKNPYTQIL